MRDAYGPPVENETGDEEAELRAFLHDLHALRPAGDDTVQRELNGLTALVAAVENLTVDQRALVMNFHRVGGLRAFAGALGDDFVLKTAGGDLHAFFLGVVFEELFSFGECDV